MQKLLTVYKAQLMNVRSTRAIHESALEGTADQEQYHRLCKIYLTYSES